MLKNILISKICGILGIIEMVCTQCKEDKPLTSFKNGTICHLCTIVQRLNYKQKWQATQVRKESYKRRVRTMRRVEDRLTNIQETLDKIWQIVKDLEDPK